MFFIEDFVKFLVDIYEYFDFKFNFLGINRQFEIKSIGKVPGDNKKQREFAKNKFTSIIQEYQADRTVIDSHEHPKRHILSGSLYVPSSEKARMKGWVYNWFGDGNVFQNIQELLKKHDYNMEIPTEVDADIDVTLCQYINEYMDVNMKHPISNIPSEVRGILNTMTTPAQFEDTIASLTKKMCTDYSAIVGNVGFASPEPGLNEMQYWDTWATRSDFFMAVLVSALHSSSFQSSKTLDMHTPWFIQQHRVHDLEITPERIKALTNSELRNTIFPFICLQHFNELFRCDRSEAILESKTYTASDLVECVIKSNNILKDNQCKRYKWKRYRLDEVYDYKHIIEHAICLILILTGVERESSLLTTYWSESTLSSR